MIYCREWFTAETALKIEQISNLRECFDKRKYSDFYLILQIVFQTFLLYNNQSLCSHLEHQQSNRTHLKV